MITPTGPSYHDFVPSTTSLSTVTENRHFTAFFPACRNLFITPNIQQEEKAKEIWQKVETKLTVY